MGNEDEKETSVWDSIEKAESLTQGGVGLVKDLASTLNGSRSMVASVVNATSGTLRIHGSHHDHGGFQTPAGAVVPPQSIQAFSSRDKAWSVGTGTEGWVKYVYEMPGYKPVIFTLKWSVPFIGDNDSWTRRSEVHPRIVLLNDTGVGNEKAEFRFTFIDLGVDLYGDIRQHWEGLGAQASSLGWPTSSEADLVGVPNARFSRFTGGVVHWRAGIARDVVGPIGLYLTGAPALTSRWLASSSELTTPDGQGRAYHFFDWAHGDPGPEPNASVFWHSGHGPHPVHGFIREEWAKQGWESGPLGYPIADPEYIGSDLVSQQFEGGSLGVHFERGGPRGLEGKIPGSP